MTIREKAEQLLEIRKEIELKTQFLAEAKERREALNADIMADLKAQGFNSVKVDGTSVAISCRKTFKIVDELAVINYLDERGLYNDYVEVVTKLNEYAPKAIENMSKKDDVPGTQIVETEFISIREKKDEDK